MREFINDCLLFKSRDPFCIRTGIATWIGIVGFVVVGTLTAVLIYQYIQL